MKEQLYTIPVNDAFDGGCECPLCQMHNKLEENALEFTLGPSYMEDNVRMETNRIGFCQNHLRRLYESPNRLGLAMILETHMDEVMKQVSKLSKSNKPAVPSLFHKKDSASPLSTYLKQLDNSCYVCNKIESTFDRYLVTIFYLYKNEDGFRKKFTECKGFCTNHYARLIDESPNHLSGELLNTFLTDLNDLFLSNMSRVREDLDWFIDKFDYRYVNEPWKNSKDALVRSAIKTDGVLGLTE